MHFIMNSDPSIESHLEGLDLKDVIYTITPIPEEDSDKESSIDIQDITFDFDHNYPSPETPEPAPAHLSPTPVRYPETLGTLIEIRESEGRGLGMFALKDILPGTCLLVETPLLILHKVETDAAIEGIVDALSQEKKQIFMSLSRHIGDESESLVARIMDCNSFSIMDGKASGVFETASRINHCCVPNSEYGWRESIKRLVVWNRFKLLEGEEVTIDYGHGKKSLRENYGFDCDCGVCTDPELENETEF
ncbi:hypothetical protein EG329_003975 [Mollisiaceae sp. DMI_Dod_QoI]|nr:hypothetical protein EG329_003975 [Helotiales sp. DMI_Dod_QoI]